MPNTTNFNWVTPADTDLVKDGAAAIRTLGNNIDASLVDLKGGTTGQVLAKATNTDLDFTWVTQDDANAIQNTIVDAKGDLITATAADVPARLGVGANGTVLTANSATATGLEWATVSAGGMTLIATGTGTGSSASITFSSIPSTYKHLMLIFEEVRTSSGNVTIQLNYNGSTSNYDFRFAGTDTTNDYNAAQIYTGRTASDTNAASDYSNGIYWIYDYAGSQTNKVATGLFAYGVNGGSPNGFRTGTARWRNSAAINQIAIGTSGGFNFGTATVIKLYGVS